jgi:two-component system, NtrC family, sensor kinase
MDVVEPRSPSNDDRLDAALPELPVLVVDDDPDILRAMNRVLSSRGWSVLSANDGVEGLAILETREVAVILSDFRMPKMDGVEFLTMACTRWPNAERLLITAYAELEALERGVNDAGIHRILNKPCPTTVLLKVVAEAMGRSRMRRQNVVLVERLKNRNAELTYVNELLTHQKGASDRDLMLFRRRWDAALNAISDPVIIVNGDLQLEGANTAAAKLAGAESAAMEGVVCHELLFSRRSQCPGCPIPDGTGRVVKELTGARRTYDARAYSMPGETPAHLCVYRDVTEREAFATQAAQLEKLAAIGRLAGGVAHEINNPLQAILSFVQMAQKPDVAPEKLPRYLEVIRESGLRCRDIVQTLRSFSRREPLGAKTVVDLRVVVETVALLFEANRKAKVGIDAEAAAAACVLGNANQLQQVLVNLVQNAVDASPQDGQVQILLSLSDREVVLAVEDQGSGIPASERDKIFEPFYTTKPEGVGTGLGLSISQHIVQQHAGTITFGASPRGGTRFEVRLARAQVSGEGQT